jgi:hypothetical protein
MAMLKLNKMEAARRQLRAALELWFGDGDPVAIHTLARAAHEVLSDVAEHLGMSHLTFDTHASAIAKTFDASTREVHQLIKGPGNFFKHADLDPDAEIHFDEGWNASLLIVCVGCLMHLDRDLSIVEHGFWTRLALERPDKLQLPNDVRQNVPPAALDELAKLTRPEFWLRYRKADALSKHRGQPQVGP